jgi:hypothetical protein
MLHTFEGKVVKSRPPSSEELALGTDRCCRLYKDTSFPLEHDAGLRLLRRRWPVLAPYELGHMSIGKFIPSRSQRFEFQEWTFLVDRYVVNRPQPKGVEPVSMKIAPGDHNPVDLVGVILRPPHDMIQKVFVIERCEAVIDNEKDRNSVFADLFSALL